MTVSTSGARIAYAGNGATVAFAFPYSFGANNELKVYSTVNATGVETLKTETTHYTVAGAGNPSGGTVTMLLAPASGETITIVLDPPMTQTVDLVENDALPVETAVEAPLDKLTRIAQRLSSRIDRSMRLSDAATSTASVLLPTPAASMLLGWNASATALTNYTIASLSGSIVTAFAASLLNDADAAEARTTLQALGAFGSQSIQQVGGPQGPTLELYHNSVGSAGVVPATVDLSGLSSTGVKRVVGRAYAEFLDATNGSEDAKIQVQVVVGGALADVVRFGPGVTVGNPTGGDTGFGTVNAGGYYRNGIELKSTVQRNYDEERAYSNNTGYTAIPNDDTKPEITEGVEILSVPITPKALSNRIRARAVVPFGPNNAGTFVASIHRGGQALASSLVYSTVGGGPDNVVVEFEEAVPSVSLVTYTVRLGAFSAVGFEIGAQGAIGARRLGGALCASLVVEEIIP